MNFNLTNLDFSLTYIIFFVCALILISFIVFKLYKKVNDLNEKIEEILINYTGTVLLVSHDREFLNNVVTSTIAFDSDKQARHYIGGYDDWLRQRPTEIKEVTVVKKAEPKAAKPKKDKPRKLSFKEKKELEALPDQIEALETEQSELHEKIADPAFYQDAGDEVAKVNKRLGELEAELETIYERWSELDAIGN